jgi:hypothetical protein
LKATIFIGLFWQVSPSPSTSVVVAEIKLLNGELAADLPLSPTALTTTQASLRAQFNRDDLVPKLTGSDIVAFNFEVR